MMYALEEAYHSLLMVGRHPSAVVNVTVPPHMVDVNVHPTKQEVRFLHDRDVTRALGAMRAGRAARQCDERRRAARQPPVRVLAVPVAIVCTRRASAFTPRAVRQPCRVSSAVGSCVRRLEAALPRSPARQDESVESSRAAVALPDAARLRVVGQVVNTYIIAEDSFRDVPDRPARRPRAGHAGADARATARAARRTRNGCSRRSPAPSPRPCSRRWRRMQRILLRLGFSVEPFGDGTWLLARRPGGVACAERR